MSGGDEQGFGVRDHEPLPFGRQSFGHSLDSPTVPFNPDPSTTYSPTFTLPPSSNHLTESHRGQSPDPADYYRRGALSTSNVSEGLGDVTTGMAPADYSQSGDKVSPLPTNGLESSRAQRPTYRSVSDSSSLGPSNIASRPGPRSRQASFKDLINKFNNTSDQVPPRPSASRSASRAASPSGSVEDTDRPRLLPRHRHVRDSPPVSITSHPRTLDSIPSSPEIEKLEPSPAPPHGNTIPPPLFQQIQEAHPRRPLFGEVLSINTQVNGIGLGIPSHLRRRGSDGSIPSPNPAFIDQAEYSAKSPLTPTAWYLGHTTSLEAVQGGVNGGKHRRVRSDLDQNPSREPLAEPWEPDMAIRAPLQRAKTGESPPESPNSKSRIPVSSHRLLTASGPDALSPTSNPTFSSRSAAIIVPSKGTSRLPIASPKQSPSRMPQDDPASFTIASRGRRDPAAGRTRNQLSESSRRLQAYIAAPPPKKSPQLRSSRPRQPVSVSHGTSVSPRSKVGDTLSSLQKRVEHNDPRSRPRQRRIPEFGNVDLETRRQRIQQAFNKTVQENERKEEAAAELRRRTLVLDQQANEPFNAPIDESLITPIPPVADTPVPEDMTTVVEESTTPVAYKKNGIEGVPKLHLNTTLPTSDAAAPHTTMDSPTLGIPQGVSQKTSMNETQPSEDTAPCSAVTTDSNDTHVTAFDPEPQSGLLQRNPSLSSRTILNQIMQIRESSPSDDSCDEPDCSMSEADDKESIQIMLGDTKSYFNSSNSTDTRGAQNPSMQETSAANQPHHRWSMSSWSSSVQNQTCDEQYDESCDDSIIAGRDTEPPTETCSVVSTRPASIADDEYSSPLQDYGVTGPSTLQASESQPFGNSFSTPPTLARLGGWDSKRVTQLYFEELTRGRNHNMPIPAVHISPEPRSHPMDTRADGRANSLTDDPVVVPGFQDVPAPDRLSHGASLVGRDDWEHASPSIMDWMQIAAEDEHATPAGNGPGSPNTEDVLTPRLLPSTLDTGVSDNSNDDSKASNTNVSREQTSQINLPNPSMDPSTMLQHVKSAEMPASELPAGPLSNLKAEVNQSAPAIMRHSPGSSEDSSLRHHEAESIRAADSSATSLAPSSENPLRPETSKSPSPEERRLKKRRYIIKEIIDTEYDFGNDMKIVEDIYKGTSTSLLDLSAEDVKVLFGNIGEVADFSDAFLIDLKQAVKKLYVIPLSQRWSSRRNRKNGLAIDRPPSTINENAEGDKLSDLEKDRGTAIGRVFVAHMTKMEKVYTEYLMNHEAATKKLHFLSKNPKVVIWLEECHRFAGDITRAWNLDALLVKPVQRITKFPLLLGQLLESTPNDHPDKAAIATALEQTASIADRINELKKRVEIVGTIGRKRNQSDVRAGLSKAFGRRTEKFRQQVGLSDLFEDKTYDALAQKLGDGYFQLQVVMRDAESYTKDIQQYMEQFSDYAGAIVSMTSMEQSSYPELESKWHLFKLTVQEIMTEALPAHIEVVRKSVIDPMIQLLQIYEGPQRIMRKRDKRLPEYARYKAINDRGDKPDKKTTEQGEQFVALNETLKDELPKLYALTSKLMEACLKNFIQIQSTWFGVLQKKIGAHVEAFPNDLNKLITDFHSDHTLMEARVSELSSCNGSILASSVDLVPMSPFNEGITSPRRPSTINSSTRPGSMTDDSPKVSRDFSIGSHPFQSPQMESHSVRTGRYRADSTLSGRVVSDGPSKMLQQVTGSSTPARTSETEPFPTLPQLSLDAPFLADVINSSHSTHAPPSPTGGRYSGFFSSAMPMSDTPNEPPAVPISITSSPAAPAVLFCAASLYNFDIDARSEGGYSYLTYVSGDVFDVIGEKGELWLARNQDDATHTVGWIWNKHFARIRD
ncbi:uncharacterized protein N7511_006340 [Penicillium nucicola]|uniref:uncharacterized protein n=1 Tax=Penicillium nucicola TaxID=1850975 RepID=UPI00254596D1|nr:uncharacterized protein N7511_006340 [Penicillium nucicola]KAJ5757646.1 hypothetical protein N7511_006340 [Penicillium nucicola]